MHNTDSHCREYAFAVILGAIGGGLIVALVTDAVPKMMSRVMTTMMGHMMAQVRDSSCDPEEM